MSKTYSFATKQESVVASLQNLFKSILDLDQVEALLIPRQVPGSASVMPTLITDPAYLDLADPLAPVFPISSARLVSKLTRKPLTGHIVVALRSCEIRAFNELVKLKQGSREQIIIVGIDCPGAYSNADYAGFAKEDGIAATQRFLQDRFQNSTPKTGGPSLTSACTMCEKPIPEQADLQVGLYGVDLSERLLIKPLSAIGETLVQQLKLTEIAEPIKRAEILKALVKERTELRDQVFYQTAAAIATTDGLKRYLVDCVNCYNCRVACPVCYCRECVMLTDVFDHEPFQYLQWSAQRGYLKMPTDTEFYHLTRLTHMSLSCVGCGQCSNACPNGVKLTELFRTIAHQTQQAFGYEAGRSIDEKMPLSLFEEDEFQEVVGIKQKRA